MIQVNNISGQLGNRILRLNNALQLSKKNKMKIQLKGKDKVTDEIFKYFEFDLGNNYKKKTKNIIVTKMGKLFFENDYDPKDLMKIKPQYQINLDNNKTNIAIHIRYEPSPKKKYMNNEEVLSKYYINAIKYCQKEYKNSHFIIFGPNSKNQFRFHNASDISETTAFLTKFKFYKTMIDYLKNTNTSFEYSITINNPKKIYIKDFIQMANCDVIISSHSTFNICAGYLHKIKKIIHCKFFIEQFIKKNDKFWVDLYNGGNKYYSLWKLI